MSCALMGRQIGISDSDVTSIEQYALIRIGEYDKLVEKHRRVRYKPIGFELLLENHTISQL